MTRASAKLPGALPFFLPANPGQRFCLFHPPAPGQAARGAVLYVHPFAEEMNKARRMAALQARAFSAQGYGVLQIDLHGCGDSSGEFSEARWPIWKQDLGLACQWLLAQRIGGPFSLWGVRLGALLALDFARDAPLPVDRLILWQPVFKGKAYLNQFLRLRLASQMLADDAAPAGGASAALRQEWAAGASIEIGGYEVASELASAIDMQDAENLAPRCPTHWFELAPGADGIIGPATMRHAQLWRAAGVALYLHPVCGVPFWASTEIVECCALLAATSALCA